MTPDCVWCDVYARSMRIDSFQHSNNRGCKNYYEICASSAGRASCRAHSTGSTRTTSQDCTIVRLPPSSCFQLQEMFILEWRLFACFSLPRRLTTSIPQLALPPCAPDPLGMTTEMHSCVPMTWKYTNSTNSPQCSAQPRTQILLQISKKYAHPQRRECGDALAGRLLYHKVRK